jgi:hypothetical protein
MVHESIYQIVKKAIYLLFLTTTICQLGWSQKRKPKPVKVVATNQFVRDSSFYTIERISLDQFKSHVMNTPSLVIQFFQPWCGGSKYWMDNFVPFYSFWEKEKVPFFIISDNLFEEDDFFISDSLVGRMVYYFNIYNIPFKTYIISEGEKLDDYQNFLSSHFGLQKLKKHFGFIIKNRKRIYSGFTYKCFKHGIKKWKKCTAKN